MLIAIENEEGDGHGKKKPDKKKETGKKEGKKFNYMNLRKWVKRGISPVLLGASSLPGSSSAASSSVSVPMAAAPPQPAEHQPGGEEVKPPPEPFPHQPAPAQPTKKRKGPQPKCSEEEYAWLLHEVEQQFGDKVPTEAEVEIIMIQGKASGEFTSKITPKGARSFLRRTMKEGSFNQQRPRAEGDGEGVDAEAKKPDTMG